MPYLWHVPTLSRSNAVRTGKNVRHRIGASVEDLDPATEEKFARVQPNRKEKTLNMGSEIQVQLHAHTEDGVHGH